jgi:hypothetical protein
MAQVTLRQAEAAKRRAVSLLKDNESVVGVGITRFDGEYAVKVNLSVPPSKASPIPTEIGGVAVRVETVGVIRKRG